MSGQKRILVADDDRIICELLRMVLERMGYEVSFANDGVSAVEMATTQRPDLVITDGLLPKLHGFEVCKAIKRLAAPPKVVLWTAVYTKPTYRYEVSNEYGADAVISKASDRAQLLATVESLLGPTASRAAGEPDMPAGLDMTIEAERPAIEHAAA